MSGKFGGGGGGGGTPDAHAASHQDGGSDEISIAGLSGTPAELTNHLNDASDAHDASAISFSPAGTIAATDVQAAIVESSSAQVAYVEFTSDVTVSATAEATPNDVVSAGAISFDGSTRVCIEFGAYATTGADGTIVFNLWDDATNLGILASCSATASGSTTGQWVGPVRLARFLTPSNASHTYKIRAWRGTANGTVNAGSGGSGASLPGWIRIVEAPS